MEVVCVCAFVCCMGSTKGTLGGRRKARLGIKTRDKGRRVFLCFQSDAESEQHVKPLWPWLSCFNDAGERSSMATLGAEQEDLKLHT